jgi:hypothetical protein
MNWYKKAQSDSDKASSHVDCKDDECYRIDREKIDEFKKNPYVMYSSGSSRVARPEEKDSKFGENERYFEGLYSGPQLASIVGYALPSNVPWLLLLPLPGGGNPLNVDMSRPTLYIHKIHAEANHPSAYLSVFRKSDFRRRQDVTREFFGDMSTDLSDIDDELVATGDRKVAPIRQQAIKDPMSFIRQYANIQTIDPRSDGIVDQPKMEALEKKVSSLINSEYNYSMIYSNGRGNTEIVDNKNDS